MQVTHVRLLVADYAASFRFWRDVVGLPVVFGDEVGGYASFDTGTAHLSIFDVVAMDAVVPVAASPVDGPDRSVVQLDVDDVDAAVGRLRGRGLTVTDPTDQLGWGIRVAHFRDPDGNLLELAAPLTARD